MKKLFKELFNYKGRYNRARFWKNYIGIYLSIFLIALILDSIIPESLEIIVLPIVFPMIYVVFCLYIKRARDLDLSIKDILWFMIPLVNIFFILKLLFSKGTVGPNKYGPDPLKNSILETA